MVEALFKCPVCGSPLRGSNTQAVGPFRCAACQELLQIPSYYVIGSVVGSVILTAALCASLGLRGVLFWVAAIVLWAPVHVLEVAFLVRILPPKVERYLPKDLTLFPR